MSGNRRELKTATEIREAIQGKVVVKVENSGVDLGGALDYTITQHFDDGSKLVVQYDSGYGAPNDAGDSWDSATVRWWSETQEPALPPPSAGS